MKKKTLSLAEREQLRERTKADTAVTFRFPAEKVEYWKEAAERQLGKRQWVNWAWKAFDKLAGED